MTDLYAVMGNPINHSKSPTIHSKFAEQAKQDLVYSAMLVPTEGFEPAVKDFFKGHGRGLNITVPFKEKAYQLANSLTPRAQTAEAVNTLVLQEDGTIMGDNTDGAGLVRDLVMNQKVDIAGKKLLVIGAGGAVRGILQPFLEQAPESITIVNRTFEKAQLLANSFEEYGDIKAKGFDELTEPFDVIINGTSASLAGELPPLPDAVIAQHTCVYDMMYGKELTPFLQWAQQQGAEKVIDGLGMLVEQAAVSFEIWRGVKPNSIEVLQDLREHLLA
ncbi:shikimate dehydrogenase [Oceaniserpentilla sp. 4NH20-0058]|uniref:shikimate dehydrogenase n=1 Tax=Oceaniserpentilla sp. 4NH20-0058 TaxID=3127660 RepID=UPI0031046434